MTDSNTHWAKTKSLTVKVLAVWFIFAFVVHWFGDALNTENFPGAYLMAGLGAQIAFALIVFWYAFSQDKIDIAHDVDEKSEGESS